MPTHHEIPVDDGFDGDRIAAVHHEATGDRWVVCAHGLASGKGGIYADLCELAVDAGFDAVRFDARGVGASEGDVRTATLSRRVAGLDAVLSYFDADPAVVYGSSLGGAVGICAAASDDRVAGLVGRAPVTDTAVYDDWRAVAAEEGEWSRASTGTTLDIAFFEDLDEYDLSATVSRVTVPVAFVHGAEDDTVPPGDTFDAAKRAAGPVRVERLAGQGHVFDEETLRSTFEDALQWVEAVTGRIS